MKITVIDVGASRGTFSEYIAKQSNDIFVVAIEPQVEVARKIRTRRNLKVEEVAIGDSFSNGTKRPFHVMANSELSTFLDVNSEIDPELWENHLPSLKEICTIDVPIISLRDLMEKHHISKIDFLKIDTQGSDFEVLESAGDRIDDIHAAVLEFPYRKDSALYSGEIEVAEALSRLSKLGFSPIRVVPNGAGECNVFVTNKNFSINSYFDLEKKLKLRSAPTLKIEEPEISRLVLSYIIINFRGTAKKILDTLFYLKRN